MSTIGGTMRRERIVPRIALLPLISNRARGYAIPDARRIAKRDEMSETCRLFEKALTKPKPLRMPMKLSRVGVKNH